MTDHAGRLPDNGARPGHPGNLWPAGTFVKQFRRKLGDDKGSLKRIMAKDKGREQLEPPTTA